MEVGRHTQALTELSQQLASNPHDVEALCLTAVCQLELGDPVQAEETARSALGIEMSWEWPFRIRSVALTQLGRSREALEMARESVRLAPHEPSAHRQLSTALLNRRRPKEAEKAANRAVELAPHDSESYLAVASVADARRRRRQERAALEKALALDPANVDARNNLAAMDLNRGKLGRGIRGLVGALQTDPQEELLHKNLDAAWVRLLARLTAAALIGAVVVAVLLGLEVGGVVPSWWPRALAGGVLGVVMAWLAWATLRHVPASARRYLRGAPRRIRGRQRFVLAVFVLTTCTAGWLAAMPPGMAELGYILLAVLIRLLQITFIITIVVGGAGWVRSKV